MIETSFYLEFTIGTKERFNSLHQLFLALKYQKELLISDWDRNDSIESYDSDKEPDWSDFLDKEAIEWFANTFDFDSDEGVTYQKLWDLTEPAIRLAHPMFNLPGNWNFESIIDSIFDSEYELVKLILINDNKGRLYYDPWAFPFGSSDSLVALIESFGHHVIFDAYREGSPYRPIVGWDYALAKSLVAKGQGFIPK
jgi:hypothetical protein